MPNNYVPVSPIRGGTNVINSTSIVDGQLLFDTDEHKIYMDSGSSRDSYGGGSDEAQVISYTDFMNLTPAQRESGKYLVTGMTPMTNAYNLDYKNGKTVGQGLDEINADLTANSKKYSASYNNGKYGFMIDNQFYEIGGGAMPALDFNNPLRIFASGALTYTATRECYLFGSGRAQSNLTISVNNKAVCTSSEANNIYHVDVPMIKLLAGDVVSITSAPASGVIGVFSAR